MTPETNLSSIFPTPDSIPPEFALEPVTQDTYLIDGELRRWDGAMREVLSPVCVQDADGPSRVPIGSFPLLSEEVGLEMLDAAERACDHGNGHWPILPVEGRKSSAWVLSFG